MGRNKERNKKEKKRERKEKIQQNPRITKQIKTPIFIVFWWTTVKIVPGAISCCLGSGDERVKRDKEKVYG